MEPHDLVLSKLGAGRDKDLEFARSAGSLGLVSQQRLLERLALVNCTDEMRTLIAARVRALACDP
jgi:hypothetical protein